MHPMTDLRVMYVSHGRMKTIHNATQAHIDDVSRNFNVEKHQYCKPIMAKPVETIVCRAAEPVNITKFGEMSAPGSK